MCDFQVLDLGDDSLLVACALLYETALLAPGRSSDCLMHLALRHRRRDQVRWDQHFRIEQGREQNRILTHTVWETDLAGA